MIIQRIKDEVIIRLSAKMKISELQGMTDYLRYIELTQKSKATQKDVDKLVAEVKKGRWSKTKTQVSK
ncbi:MAG: hypothetical protein SGJ10_02155 [Bacteroidota bacterium]|nr:hypothetical protein [Bacteroidota bacterium]